MLCTELANVLRCGKVDGWQEYLLYASLAGSLDDGRKVVAEFFTVEVAMGVEHS